MRAKVNVLDFMGWWMVQCTQQERKKKIATRTKISRFQKIINSHMLLINILCLVLKSRIFKNYQEAIPSTQTHEANIWNRLELVTISHLAFGKAKNIIVTISRRLPIWSILFFIYNHGWYIPSAARVPRYLSTLTKIHLLINHGSL